jgi:D-threonine aldolase
MVHELPTPALVVDRAALDHNIATMATARPGPALRPHVKAFKSTDMARHVAERGGHRSFCCATLRELEGMAAAGLGEDLLLANETLDGPRLRRIVESGDARITVAVDSTETVEVAAAAGADVLIDVDVGLPRCGCAPEQAGDLAASARRRGLTVRGVMGYEGHVVGNPDRSARTAEVERSMALLQRAHRDVGGLRSAGGTGTYDLHHWADEVQAGSYLLMDTHYGRLGLPFRQALFVETTVISVSAARGWGVADAGLKAFGMDHGDPDVEGHQVFFCSDEHTTFLADPDRGLPQVGSRLRMTPAHVDPTVACHERMYLLDGDHVVDEWPVDLRNW